MSTSLLYHRFGIHGYTYCSQHFVEDHTFFVIDQPRERLRCSQCAAPQVWIQGRVERVFRTLPIGGQPTSLVLQVPRLCCLRCNTVRQAKIGFADPKKHYTKSFERYALELSRLMTIKDVADHLQVGWNTIKKIQANHLQRKFGKPKLHKLKQIAIDEINVGKKIQANHLQRKFGKPKLHKLKQIAIDEINVGKGHRYLTIVLNLLSGVVVFVGDGKGADALKPFWKRLRRSHAKIEAVATDMSAAYIQAVRENIRHAVHVFDRFHVVKLFNDKLSAFRRQLFHELTAQGQKLLKGIRWLLLKNPENLNPLKRERQRLERALSLNEPLAIAYYMKEDLRQIWMQGSKAMARLFLEDWLARARVSGIRMLEQFADTLEEHQEGILNYYDYPISTGPLEGTNTKIQLMKRRAYGYRDHEFFKLKILGAHETRYALVG